MPAMRCFVDSVIDSVTCVATEEALQIGIEEYRGNIRLSGDIDAWLRLTSLCDDVWGNCLEISSICIEESHQHKGIFTKLMSNLKGKHSVNSILVGGVCTQAMLNWCLKNGCTYACIDTYRYK